MKYWNSDKVKAFRDVDGTVFVRGPFEIGGKKYDWKLIDNLGGGPDYCTTRQMEMWDVELKQVIENEHYLNIIEERSNKA